jgi:hypothetical protein
MSMMVLCDILENLMSATDLQASEESQNQVRRLLQSTNIEAALVCDPRTRNFEVHALYEENLIHLVGPYLEEKDLKVVKEIVGETVQVEEIDYSPGYTSTIDIDGWQQFTIPGTIT